LKIRNDDNRKLQLQESGGEVSRARRW